MISRGERPRDFSKICKVLHKSRQSWYFLPGMTLLTLLFVCRVGEANHPGSHFISQMKDLLVNESRVKHGIFVELSLHIALSIKWFKWKRLIRDAIYRQIWNLNCTISDAMISNTEVWNNNIARVSVSNNSNPYSYEGKLITRNRQQRPFFHCIHRTEGII